MTVLADDNTVNPFFLALNVVVVAGIALVFLLPRIRERREAEAELPTSIRPNRGGQELADVVTDWAKATGVLAADGTPDPEALAEAERSSDQPS